MQLCFCSVRICILVFIVLLRVILVNVFISRAARSLSEISLSVKVAQHAFRGSRRHFKTAGSCNIPVQSTLINCCAKVFHCRALTGWCGNIQKMTAVLQRWFNVKSIHHFLAIWRDIPNNATKQSRYKIVGVIFVIVLDNTVGWPL